MIDFSRLYHDASKDRTSGGLFHIPNNHSTWPQEWKTIHYKAYPGFVKLSLPHAAPESRDIFETIKARRSRHTFSSREFQLRELSQLLEYGCGLTKADGIHRAQPSGGGLYPIETYIAVFTDSKDLPAGLYHYNVKNHELEIFWQKKLTKADVTRLYSYPWAQKASIAVILTAVFERNHVKYGPRGYRQILLEAGHIGQNLYLISEAMGVKCTAIDGVNDAALENLLEVDGYTESVVSNLLLG